MSLEALPESVAPPPTAGRLAIVQHLLTEALRTLQAANQTEAAPTAPVAKPKPKAPVVPCLKPSRPVLRQVSPEVRARAEMLRLKAMMEPDDPLPPPVRRAFEELMFAIRALNGGERAAALAHISTAFPTRTVD